MGYVSWLVRFAIPLSTAGCPGSASHVQDAYTENAGDDSASSYCNTAYQFGCSGDYKCTFDPISLVPSCVPDGIIAAGGACVESADACVRGTMCVGGRCLQFCSPGSVDANGHCQTGLCVESKAPRCQNYGACTCSPACDPPSPTCESGDECFFPRGQEEGPGCLPAGTSPLGAGCVFPNDCGTGLTCADETIATIGYPSCLRRCLTSGTTCVGSETCHERTLGDGYGVCL